MIINDIPIIMIRCLLCTIIIEVLVALVLKVKNKKDVINIILVNILTNPIVVIIPIFIAFNYGIQYQKITLYILEVVTVIVEGFIYLKVLNHKRINPFLLSLVLNLSSYLIGLLINNIIWEGK